MRYLETFTFENKVPESLYDCRIVKLTLQPLVENAIFHGIEPTGECGTITLTGREENGEDVYKRQIIPFWGRDFGLLDNGTELCRKFRPGGGVSLQAASATGSCMFW